MALISFLVAMTGLRAQIGVGAKAPSGATIYFDGSRTLLDKHWAYWDGPRLAAKPPIKWQIVKDPVDVGTVLNSNDPTAAGGLYGTADIVTKQSFRDFRLHIEFLVAEKGGNSGVYLQNRYEIQVLDGDTTMHGMAAVINETPSPYFAYNGTGQWNAYDIVFRAARFNKGKLVEKAMLSMYFNGAKVYTNQTISQVWGGPNSGIDGGNDGGKGITDTPGGLKLQAEGHNVLYRNIWMKELELRQADTDVFAAQLHAPESGLRGLPRFAQVFPDHAVLQRGKEIPVWGWANPQEQVQVTLGQQVQKTLADSAGRWRVVFNSMEAGGPYSLKVAARSGTTERTDVLIGDVWLCSGQSNMEWTVRQAYNFAKERQGANLPRVRHFKVGHEVALNPVDDLDTGKWVLCTPANVEDFTAVGYFFAKSVFEKTGVPIGLLNSSWGGSQVESWVSKEGMLASEELRAYAENFPASWEDADLRLERSIKAQLLGNPDAAPTLEDEKKYLDPEYDFSAWKSANPMWQWDWKGIWAWRGNGFMGKTVDIPAEMTGKITTLGLAENFSFNEIYVNGALVSAGILKGTRHLLVPANTWKPGLNKIMVKMDKTIEPEWFGLGLTGSDKDLFVRSETASISLAGNDWKIMPSFAEPHGFAHSSNNVGTGIYNAMIAPLSPFALRGVLWYQGESNAGRAYQYRSTFPLLIQDWRQRWKEELPFYFVQLAAFGKNQSSNEGSEWAELREAQAKTLALPNTGMAVTIDIGDPKDIHPGNKQDVGKRLAAIALKNTYQIEVPSSGPMYKSVEFQDISATVSFDFTGSGLVANDKFGYLKGFEVAGDDKVFHYAKAEIRGNQVVVWHPKGQKPASVRYAWADSPDDANLFNKEGFPACPFRTDDWPGKTAGERFK